MGCCARPLPGRPAGVTAFVHLPTGDTISPGPNAGNPPKVIPEPGDYPYGAPMYAPDGTPLWNNLPPAPPPGAPRDPGATPGSEPFVVPFPGQQPTPLPPQPLPVPAAPSP